MIFNFCQTRISNFGTLSMIKGEEPISLSHAYARVRRLFHGEAFYATTLDPLRCSLFRGLGGACVGLSAGRTSHGPITVKGQQTS